MPSKTWRPASEAEAAGTPAVFIEWLRAMHGVALAGPAGLAVWRRTEPVAFAAAITGFANLPLPPRGEADIRDILLRGQDHRPALVLGTRAWSRADLRHATPLPATVGRMLARLTPADLPALAAGHLLDAGTLPDTRLHWTGNADDPWPLGAWIVGAAIILDG